MFKVKESELIKLLGEFNNVSSNDAAQQLFRDLHCMSYQLCLANKMSAFDYKLYSDMLHQRQHDAENRIENIDDGFVAAYDNAFSSNITVPAARRIPGMYFLKSCYKCRFYAEKKCTGRYMYTKESCEV